MYCHERFKTCHWVGLQVVGLLGAFRAAKNSPFEIGTFRGIKGLWNPREILTESKHSDQHGFIDANSQLSAFSNAKSTSIVADQTNLNHKWVRKIDLSLIILITDLTHAPELQWSVKHRSRLRFDTAAAAIRLSQSAQTRFWALWTQEHDNSPWDNWYNSVGFRIYSAKIHRFW